MSLLASLVLSGCLIKDEIKDGLWEISTTVSTATLAIDSEGVAEGRIVHPEAAAGQDADRALDQDARQRQRAALLH